MDTVYKPPKESIFKLKGDSRLHGFFANDLNLFALVETDDNQMTMQSVKVKGNKISLSLVREILTRDTPVTQDPIIKFR
jgi:hypothetical protein